MCDFRSGVCERIDLFLGVMLTFVDAMGPASCADAYVS